MHKLALLGLGLVGLTTATALVYEQVRFSVPTEMPKAETEPAPALPADIPRVDATAPQASQERRFPPLPLTSAAVAPNVPDLPTVEVAARPVHTVPSDEPPVPKVTILDRNGRVIATREPPPPLPTPAPTPPPATTPFGGQAQATGPTTLAVGGKTVRLFGIRVPDARDRCGLGSGDGRNCVDVARDALSQRLKRYPNVYCRTPADQRDNLAAICIDASGTDLGGFLVAEGYALADIGQSYEYFGSEGIARYYRRGLWRNR